VSTDPGASQELVRQQDEDGRVARVEGSAGVQAGSGNVQYNIFYGHPAPASGGRFGFSAQLAIWEDLGALGTAPPADGYTERDFGTRVGWLVAGRWLSYEEYTFDLSAPAGHLPVLPTGIRTAGG
jgi:hypothetical protein